MRLLVRCYRPMGTLIIYIVGVYILIGLFIYIFQNRLLYHPNTYTLAQAQGSAKERNLCLWPVESVDYHGFVSLDMPSEPQAVVLVFHGNAGSARDRTYYIDAFQGLDYIVILIEYPGYGAKEGMINERALINAGIQAAQLVRQQFKKPLFILGESLGCGVAAGVAADTSLSIDGVILITPWDTLGRVAQRHYWYLPAQWLARDSYDNIRYLRDFKGPVAVVMAEQDTLIPNIHTRCLYESLKTTKRLWALPNVGHNDWLGAVNHNWWQEVMDFLKHRD